MLSPNSHRGSREYLGFLAAVVGFVVLNLVIATQWGIPWSVLCLGVSAFLLFKLERYCFDEELSTLANEALSLDSAFSQIVIESMAAAVTVADHVGNLVYFNRKANELTGVGLLEAQVEEWADAYGLFELDGKTHYPSHRLPLARALSGERVVQQELVLRNRFHVQGIYLSITASPIYGKKGELRGAVAVFEDITDRKLLEKEVFHREVILAEKVKKRTEELNHSNEELKRFAYAVAHDLKEPIRSMGVLSQLLERHLVGKLPPETEKWLDEIISRGQQLNRFIDDLLIYARAKDEQVRTAIVDVDEVLKTVRRNLQAIMDESHAVLEVEPLPKLVGESTHLVQVFQNLISNSLKYCSSSPVVKVGARCDGERWLFWVKDNGIGVPAGKQEEIFLPFFRGRENDVRPGSGIGLAICQRIVERYGGKIWAESKEGQGTTVFFTVAGDRVSPQAAKPALSVVTSR